MGLQYSFERVVEMKWLPGTVAVGCDGRRYKSHCGCYGERVQMALNGSGKLDTSNVDYFQGFDAKCDRCGRYTWYYVNEVLFAQEVDTTPLSEKEPGELEFAEEEAQEVWQQYENLGSITSTLTVRFSNANLTVDGGLKQDVWEDAMSLLHEIEDLLSKSDLFEDVDVTDWEW